MNNDRRKSIAAIVTQLQGLDLDSIKSSVEEIRDEEQEAFDNMPESLQEGERGQAMSTAIEALEEVVSALDEFSTDDLIAKLEEAAE